MVTNLRGSRILAGAVVVLLLGAVYGLAGLRHTMSLAAGSLQQSPRVATATSVQRVCPAPGASTSPGDGVVVIFTGRPGSARTGAALNVTRLTGTGSAATGPRVLSVTQPGVPRLAQVAVDRVTARKTARAQQAGGTQTSGAGQPGTGTGTGTKQGTGTKKKTGTQQKPTAQLGSALATTPVSGGVVIQASGSLAQGLEAEQTGAGSLPTAACASPGTNFWFTGRASARPAGSSCT